jgi:hypothetical protein
VQAAVAGGADLRGADLSELDVTNVDLRDVDLNNAILQCRKVIQTLMFLCGFAEPHCLEHPLLTLSFLSIEC